MSIIFTNANDHLDCATTPLTGPPLALSLDIKTTIAQRRLFSVNHSGQDSDFFSLGLNLTAVTGEMVALTYSLAGSDQSTPSNVITPNVWQNGLAAWLSTFTRYCWLQGANKATTTGIITPAGLNGLCIGGRLTDHNNNIGGSACHACLWNRADFSDVEALAYGTGFHPRLFRGLLEYWSLFTKAATHVGELTGLTFVATGTTQGTDDSVRSTYYKGAAIGAQVWQQNTAITPIPITSGFAVVNAPFTGRLFKVGATTGSTTTTAAATTATRTIPLTALAGISAGDYVSVGGAAKVPVMAVLALSIVVTKDQTFTLGATVQRFPIAAVTIGGITLGSTISGTPTVNQTIQQDYFVRQTTTGSSLFADTNLFPITIAVPPAPPDYTVAPAITQLNVDGYGVTLTPLNNCTMYLGAYPAGSGTPTKANLKIGSGALAFASKAITGTDSLTVAGLQFPVADLFVVLNNALGDSAIFALLNQFKLPPVGTVYRTLTDTIDPDTPYFGNTTIGDIEESRAVVLPANVPDILRGDGNDAFTPGTAARQLRTARMYNHTTRAWYLDDAGQQFYNVWYNDVPPVVTAVNTAYVIPLGAMTPIPLIGLFQSQDGPNQVITALNALPAGMSLVANQITGTATVGGITGLRLRSTDLAGATTDTLVVLLVGPLFPPNLFNLDYRDATQLALASFFKVAAPVFIDYNGPPNLVLSQDPPITQSVAPFTIITLTVSRTPGGTVPKYGLVVHAFTVVPQADGDLDLNHPDGSG